MKRNNIYQKNGGRRYASYNDLTIKNILEATEDAPIYRFKNKDAALNFLQSFYTKYHVRREEDEEVRDYLVLWVRGLNTHDNPVRKNQGYKGDFIKINIKYLERYNIYTFSFEHLEVGLKYHPERGYKIQRIPNYGEPIIRDFTKGKEYQTFEHIKSEFNRLQEKYPAAIIPGGHDRLYVQIFKKDEKSNVKKYIFEIIESETGLFKVEIRLNEHQEGKLKRIKFNQYMLTTFYNLID